MKKLIYTIIILLILIISILKGEVISTLSEVGKPSELVIEKDFLYVVEKSCINIYSSKNYKFIKKFGRQGKGPREFDSITSVIPHKGKILVNSLGKISFYKRDGTFLNEKKIDSSLGFWGLNLSPLDNGFIGTDSKREGTALFHTINLYDSEIKKIKELNSMVGKSNNRIQILSESFFYRTHKNRIFISSKTGLSLDVLNEKGKKLYNINYPNYKRIKFEKEEILEGLKRKNKYKYDMLKNRLSFPEYYPDIKNFFISNGKIYIATWRRKNNKNEFFIFTEKGKFLKHTKLPLYFMDGIVPISYPALTIDKNCIYQIVENEDTEEWELHKNKIL